MGGPLVKAGKYIKSYDKFGKGFALKMDGGVGSLKTYMGLCCTIVWVVIILVFAAQKLDILINKKQVSVLGSKKLSFFSDEGFSYKEGLNIAVAYTAYDN